MSIAKMGATAILLWIGVLIMIAIGWVMNVIDLVGMTNVLSTGEGIVRIVGIFIFPLGAVMGWFF